MQGGITLLCPRCKYNNPHDNRFCGHCGLALETALEPLEEIPARQPVSVGAGGSSRSTDTIFGLDFEPLRAELFQEEAAARPRPVASTPARSEPARPEPVNEPPAAEPVRRQPEREPSYREPTIAGPSFLGIGTEPEKRSGSYSYLLDYEEPASHRGRWMALVLLVVAVLVGLQFRPQLKAWATPIYGAVKARVNPQPASPQSAPAAPDTSANSAATQSPAPAQPPAAAGDSQPTQNSAAQPASEAKPQSAESQPAPKSDDHAAPAADEKSTTAAAAKPSPATQEEAGAPARKTAKPAQTLRASRTKPAEAQPQDDRLLVLAQKYIRGDGVRKDCTTGVAYLRESMKHPSAAAATQMGALYATGTCMPLDRVSAYRWFGSALQMNPGNGWLAREREELYAQMSTAERQRANGQ